MKEAYQFLIDNYERVKICPYCERVAAKDICCGELTRDIEASYLDDNGKEIDIDSFIAQFKERPEEYR
jgi:hypothetical protein